MIIIKKKKFINYNYYIIYKVIIKDLNNNIIRAIKYVN